MLRQPLEEHTISISRVYGTYQFPAKFMFVGATNPCKCGYYPDISRCGCSEGEVRRYLGKISRPILDRIDMMMETFEVSYSDIYSEKEEETSEEIRKRVERVHNIQKERYQGTGIHFNSELTGKEIQLYCNLKEREKKMLEEIYRKMELSVRSYFKVLKVARTIADMEEKEEINEEHIAEAVYYRSVDKKYWGGRSLC
jgi:magnesium chelatase family protein